ncbi:TRAP transporter small permease subunit [Pelomicrobium sp. G1]|uniref:TRAP transporter small permease subunit n=1 Tax=unclassified Pelomicrobium TaxID=2815318 RepID=UPI003F75A60D
MAAWLVIPLIAASCYEVFSRYVLNEPTLWAFEIGYMVMGTHFLIGMAYTLRENEHVRVDLFYSHVSRRARALIDAFTYVVLVLPLCLWLSASLWEKALKAYETQERSGMSAFNPPIWPYRAVFFAAFALLSLQAIAQLIRALMVLAGKKLPEEQA